MNGGGTTDVFGYDWGPAKLGRIVKHAGIAGQLSYSVTVTYDGESPASLTFVGSVYGGPVVMASPNGSQVFVKDPERFGKFGPEWVRRFFAPTV